MFMFNNAFKRHRVKFKAIFGKNRNSYMKVRGTLKFWYFLSLHTHSFSTYLLAMMCERIMGYVPSSNVCRLIIGINRKYLDLSIMNMLHEVMLAYCNMLGSGYHLWNSGHFIALELSLKALL